MKEHSSSRRRFLQGLGLLTGALATGALTSCKSDSCSSSAATVTPDTLGPSNNYKPRPSGSIYMGNYAAPKIDKVRFAFIGVGARGSGHASQIASIEGTEVVAICDLYEDWATNVAKNIEKKTGKLPQLYTNGPEAYKTMLAEVKPDAVIISTDWKTHAPMCIDAMEAGAHAFVEVPIATTIEDMWKLVDVSERTKKHCMMMENCNYGREELLYLNMVNLGLIGQLLHGEAAYIHELRGQMNDIDRGTGSWRTYEWANRNGNLYPTHGLGPVSQYMNIARTDDMFARMTSFSSPGICRPEYIKKSEKLSKEPKRQMDFKGCDMSTSIIKTVLGRTIMVQWDESSPRPYSRHNLIQGSMGTLAGYPTRVAGEKLGDGNYHSWIQGPGMDAIYKQYEHPLWTRVGELAQKMGGHGGMDFIMLFRIVECLRKGEPIDQNVYEGCLWSAVGPMSEMSVLQGGAPQVFPDFTRGDWKTTNRMPIVQ